ncbi:hypothetical protein KIW84_070665 [Lathyrus oleraceus]|uniref:Gamma-tubulin complex component n=1 Tax=Pisum sativum TaxID=3888 RepID=A0A9D4VG91_PEA|nr:hypothetical protein KIW84_070665 [Pisum sativum]
MPFLPPLGNSFSITRPSWHNLSTNSGLGDFPFKDCGSTSQAKAMAGDNAVRLLLEKMTQCASRAYMSILERWVYEGVIDDPYGEFFIAGDKSLQKESLTRDYDAKYWRQRYSLKDELGGTCNTVMIANISLSILSFGETQNTLHWADKAKEIRTKAPDANEDLLPVPKTETDQAQLILELQK